MTHKEKLEGITELEKNHQKRIESKRKKTEKSKKKIYDIVCFNQTDKSNGKSEPLFSDEINIGFEHDYDQIMYEALEKTPRGVLPEIRNRRNFITSP